MSLSEYILHAVFDKEITERFSEKHIELYKMMIKYHKNRKSYGN
ncbi:plasmid mobilization protein [Gelidibacter pelagius]